MLGELECLSRSLQNRSQTIDGMQTAVGYVSSALQQKRSEEKFTELFEKAVLMVETLEIEPIEIPHQRKPPKRFTGGASPHKPKTPEEYYRIEFFKVLDSLDMQFKERFNQPDLEKLKQIENVLLTGKICDVIGEYPEMDMENLRIQLQMFHSKHKFMTTGEAVDILKQMPSEVRGLFDEVEKLVRLLLVVPVASAEAERSFSALKRLKNWLRSTMTQQRLNNVSVCHVHQTALDLIAV